MTRLHIALMVIWCTTFTWAEIGVPRPEEQLKRATVVAVGSLTVTGGPEPTVSFTASRILKGDIMPEISYLVDCPAAEIRHTIPDLVDRAGGRPFLLVAEKDPHSATIWPVYGAASAWPKPRGMSEDTKMLETLEGSLAFAISILHPKNGAAQPLPRPVQAVAETVPAPPVTLPRPSEPARLPAPSSADVPPPSAHAVAAPVAPVPWLWPAAAIGTAAGLLWLLLKRRASRAK